MCSDVVIEVGTIAKECRSQNLPDAEGRTCSESDYNVCIELDSTRFFDIPA